MTQHARPHLQTHTRSKNHSAVAGAAYRLGLRLVDERTGICHDFRKRKVGEEIVRALTVAPAGAPSWATNPAQLWNRVERAEKRKDAQVARDYRIPIPLGLTDDQAGNLAEEMARFIANELHTPVSIGLHRDADRDVLGEVKPDDKQGFHAHLYFPTRSLAEVAGGVDEDGSAEGGAAATPKVKWGPAAAILMDDGEPSGFGLKFAMHSSKQGVREFVESLNTKWADLANQYTGVVGLTADYDHRSYKRMGLNLTPQPTMGRAVAAMERQGVSTVKGDRLKEALAMAEVYTKVHAAELKVQHAQAVSDRAREGAKTNVQVTTGPTLTTFANVLPRLEQRRQKGIPVAKGALGSMTARFHAASSKHMTRSEREALERALFWVHLLERILATVSAMQVEADQLTKKRMQAKAELLTAQFNIEQSREHRGLAARKLQEWEKSHAWRLKVNKLAGQGSTAEHQQLRSRVKVFNDQVQSMKKNIRFYQQESDAASNELNALTVKQIEVEAKFQKRLRNLRDLGPDFEPRMLAAASVEQRQLLVAQMKKSDGGNVDDTILTDEPTGLDVERKSTLKM
ncbi:hypothetical protein B5P43_10405 [Bacillus sp. SRB_336]|nr:hypothetical protein B5P43_10405 [Bacillus sp. SRB_336]